MVFLILKRYRYNGPLPLAVTDICGEVVKIQNGQIILYDGEMFETLDGHHRFNLSAKILTSFTRDFTEKEKSIYNTLHLKAAVAAMQGLLSDHSTLEICQTVSQRTGIDIQHAVARNAVAYADALIDELTE